jgi:transcriptional regulator with XRE-family HTH domain
MIIPAESRIYNNNDVPPEAGSFEMGGIAMTRKRDGVIDKKIGAFIRMQRVKLGMSQTDLGKALGVTFQQIQKYERGTNSVASSRIPDLCRTLAISPNDLFGISAKMDGEVSDLGSWGMRTALRLQELRPAGRQAVDALLTALPKR